MSLVWLCLLPIFICTGCHAGNTGYFWQLNDLHYDHTYWGSQESCVERRDNPAVFGRRDCDAPWQLVESSIKALKELGPDPEFITWLGDSTPHFVVKSRLRREDMLQIIHNISVLIQETFPDVPVFPLPGNHDYYPKNKLESGRSDFYERMAESWQPWFDDDTKAKFINGGFYSKKISENPPVKGIVPNTNLIYDANPLYKNVVDPGGQFAWMKTELEAARSAGEKVHIFLHIAPGYAEPYKLHFNLHVEFNDRFVSILQDYADIIIAVQAAHSHRDSFRLLYKNGSPESVLFLTPSVTPFDFVGASGKRDVPHYPGVRRYMIDKSNYDLVDYEQFFLNLTTANQQMSAKWQKLYSFNTIYSLDRPTPSNLQVILNDMKSLDSTYFATYQLMNQVKGAPVADACDLQCRCVHHCSIEFMMTAEYEACVAQSDEACMDTSQAGALTPPLLGMATTVMLLITSV